MTSAPDTFPTLSSQDADPRRPELDMVSGVFLQCPWPTLILDASLAPAACNAAFETRYGPGAGLDALGCPPEAGELLRARGGWQGAGQGVTEGGSAVWVAAWAVTGGAGSVGYVVQARPGSPRDLAGRLEASRRAIGALAHDFNNALAGVAACVEMGLDMLPPGHDEVRFELEEAYRACAGTRETLKSVLALSRGSGLEPTRQSLGLAARRAVRETGGEATDVVVEWERSVESDTVLAHPELLDRLLGQVLRNAWRALRDADRPPRLRLRLTSASAPEGVGAAGAGGAAGVRLEVEDNGPGMPPDVLERAFDPYFSTRTREEGRGLGLTAAWAAARELGGDVAVWSAPGQGTRVGIWLPLADAAGSDAGPAREE